MSTVFLSAGHGGTDPGAVGHGLNEKNINLNILLACKSELERHGVKVVTSRVKDENDPVQEETNEANKSGADVAVSFHTNAGKGDGSESYYYCGSNDKGKKLAELCEKYTKAIGQNSRGIKSGNGLYFVKNTNIPAVLCECAFIDNSTDVTIIDTKAEQERFGVAYAKAILEYLGIKYKTVTTKAPEVKSESYLVKVTIPNLNIRSGAGTNFSILGKCPKGVYTIIETKSGKGSVAGWGKLKSSDAKNQKWISLDYAKKV